MPPREKTSFLFDFIVSSVPSNLLFGLFLIRHEDMLQITYMEIEYYLYISK